MYSLIGSLVVMGGHEAGALTGTFAHASQFKYGQFRNQMGLCTVQKGFAPVLIVLTFICTCFIRQVLLSRSYGRLHM